MSGAGYRIPLHLLGVAVGVSERTVRRWVADGRLVVADDGTVDDMEAQALRDLLRERRRDTRWKRLP